MKVTITDPKNPKAPLTIEDLPLGTLFTMNSKRAGFYIGLIIKGARETGKNIIRLNGNPIYAVSVEDSWYRNEDVTIIKTVELSTEEET